MVQRAESLNRQVEDLSRILNNSLGIVSMKESVSASADSESVDGVKTIADEEKPYSPQYTAFR